MADAHKVLYPAASSSPLTFSLHNVASSGSLVAGRQSAVISNLIDLDLSKQIAGKVRTGTSPAAGIMELWLITPIKNDAGVFTWPDTFGGSDGNVTVTSRAILLACGILLWRTPTDATSNRDYPIGQRSILQSLDFTPEAGVLFFTHSTNVNTNTSTTESYVHVFRQQAQSVAL